MLGSVKSLALSPELANRERIAVEELRMLGGAPVSHARTSIERIESPGVRGLAAEKPEVSVMISARGLPRRAARALGVAALRTSLVRFTGSSSSARVTMVECGRPFIGIVRAPWSTAFDPAPRVEEDRWSSRCSSCQLDAFSRPADRSRMTLRRWILWFLACGIGGALLDLLHTHLGVLSYREPFFLGQAWWVAPNFGVGGVVFLALGKRMSVLVPTVSDRSLWIAGATFVVAYAASCFSYGHGWWMLLGFVVVWLFQIARPAMLVYILYSAALALLGTAYELTVTSTGAYFFHHPDIMTVPAWLPGLYLDGAPFGLMLAKRIAR